MYQIEMLKPAQVIIDAYAIAVQSNTRRIKVINCGYPNPP